MEAVIAIKSALVAADGRSLAMVSVSQHAESPVAATMQTTAHAQTCARSVMEVPQMDLSSLLITTTQCTHAGFYSPHTQILVSRSSGTDLIRS